MRKLSVFNLVTLDGFFSGQGGDISWHRVDPEFQEFAEKNSTAERKCVLTKAERVDQNEIVELLGNCKIGYRYVDVIDPSDFNHALLLCVAQLANARSTELLGGLRQIVADTSSVESGAASTAEGLKR